MLPKQRCPNNWLLFPVGGEASLYGYLMLAKNRLMPHGVAAASLGSSAVRKGLESSPSVLTRYGPSLFKMGGDSKWVVAS